VAAILQFRLMEQSDNGRWVYWWALARLWEDSEEARPVSRPTERKAIRNVRKVAGYLEAVGIPELTSNHLRALYWDRQWMAHKRGQLSAHWTPARKEYVGLCSLIAPSRIESILNEASAILETRDLLGLSIDWHYQPNRRELANVREIEKAERYAVSRAA
jgi:hypothetical protein